MKSQSLWKWSLGLSLVVLQWVAESAEAETKPTNSVPVLAKSAPGAQTPAPQSPPGQTPGGTTAAGAAVAEATPDDALASAAVRPISAERELPANLNPTAPTVEIIKMANAGVAESVLLAFVTNSTSLFDLGAEEIIYLNDIGVPSKVVAAMIQHDQALKASGAMLAATPWANPGQSAPPDTIAPLAASAVAPQPVPGAAPPAQMAATYSTEPAPPPTEVSDAGFYDALSPYGNWVDVAGYGPCWQPTVVVVNPAWQPYFDCGHWVYSDCGWYWLSDYSWGWAPFHYGRWFHHGRLGWCWAPDRVWGPSWVSWRYTDAYCGWAPLPPGCSFTIGVGLTFHGHPVHDNDDCGLRPSHYNFVAWHDFRGRELHGHGLPPQRVSEVYEHSTVATRISGDRHTVVNSGLPVNKVAAATRAPVQTVAVREASGPAPRIGRAEQYNTVTRTLEVYRPRLAETTQRRVRPQTPTGDLGNGPRVVEAPGLGTTRTAPTRAPRVITGVPATESAPPAYTRTAPAAVKPTSPGSTVVTIPSGLNRQHPVTPPTGTGSATPWAFGAERRQVPTSTRSPVPEWRDDPPAGVAPTQTAVPRPPVNPAWQRPAAPEAAPATPYNGVPRYGEGAPRFSAPQPATSYQAPARSAPAEVPRYTTPAPSYRAPAYAPSRSPSYEARPAPAAAPAPRSAPAPTRSSGGTSSPQPR